MKTTFAPGTKVTASWLNAIQSLTFDDEDLDGHLPRITDAMLSNAAGNLKAVWSGFSNQFLVKASTGLSVTIEGGVFTNSQDLGMTIAPSALAMPASATTYIWVTDAGAFASGASLPVIALPIAVVTTGPSGVLSVSDLRPRFKVGPQSRAIAVFGGRSSTDLVYASNASIEGVINCRNFTLNAGVTLTIPSGFLKIVASGTVTIAGAIVCNPAISGGALFAGSLGACVLLPDPGRGFGGGGGHNGAGGRSYPYEANRFGSGGGSGFGLISVGGQANLTTSRGGNGAGSVEIESGGDITVSGTISCNGENAVSGIIANLTSGNAWVTGGGGGSGGSVVLRSLSKVVVTAAGSLSVRGGNGGTGASSDTTTVAVGGGGGGGGRIITASPATNLTGATLLLGGGLAGAASGVAPSGYGGTPGGGFGGSGGGSGIAGSIGQLTMLSFVAV